MDLFKRAKEVRLRSHHDKYLLAEDDEERVSQVRSGASRAARWTVEFVLMDSSAPVLRLKSCYGRYLTASNEPFLLGFTGRKVLQTLPAGRLDSSVEWEPVRDGFQVKLKTRYGQFLRANGGLPPWRNSVTHDIPHRTATQDWVLWDVDVVDMLVRLSPTVTPRAAAAEDQSGGGSSPASSTASVSPKHRLSKQESLASLPGSPHKKSLPGSPHKTDGRTIYYMIADGDGDVDEAFEGACFSFKGTTVAKLTEKLEEETGLTGIFVCSKNPLNGKLYPLRLHLPPNNTTMKVFVVTANSRVARNF